MHGHGLLNVIMSAVLGAEAEPASLAGSSMSAQCITAVSYGNGFTIQLKNISEFILGLN